MIPAWLNTLAIASLIVAAICAVIVLIDLARFPQQMPIMNWVWPITALYGGPLALWMYARLGRPASRRAIERNGMRETPFYASVAVGASHCGAGCVLGDIISEFAIFFTGFTILGSVLATEYVGDYILAYAFGIAFQFFAIAPMRHLSFLPGMQAAIKADTLSLTAFEVGLFGWMAVVLRSLSPALDAESACILVHDANRDGPWLHNLVSRELALNSAWDQRGDVISSAVASRSCV